ncbi:DUF308 domain-containing protein [Actinomycetospora lemnae]|uniref:DUF308 domain-containing protein n=1 Tax=Actinomycetospora lemnae TaxID=3019891 RepID=A0ABT5T0H8_9PSEU|nr:DUF308 domain-containing protein [Actinomycetospora sp. DW7H6]MDD7968624.1 DUF308 domain-containing protein [Actinomycetospora sp. DW7H6]
MTEPPDPPPTVATMRTIGIVWAVAGGLAILVGAVATVFAIVIFGVLALVLGVALIGIQDVRARSAIRASRTLTNAPAPPADPPRAGRPPRSTPGPPRSATAGPTPGPPDDPTGGPSDTGDDQGAEAAVGSTGSGSSGSSGPSGSDDAGGSGEDGDRDGSSGGPEVVEHDREGPWTGAAEAEDGTGVPNDPDARRDA